MDANDNIQDTVTESVDAEQVSVVKKPPRAKKVLRAISAVACTLPPVLVGIFATLAALGCEFNSKYLDQSVNLTLTVVILAALLTPFFSFFALRKEHELDGSKIARWLSLAPAAASLYLSAHTLLNDLGKWGDAILILSLIAAAYFILKLTKGKDALKLCGVVGMFLLGTAIIALLYLDFEIELNSPFKLAVQFGAVGFMIGTIADARAILSRISAGGFILLKSIASSLCILCSGLILVVFARDFAVLPEVYLVSATLYACYAISALAEMISLSVACLKSDI